MQQSPTPPQNESAPISDRLWPKGLWAILFLTLTCFCWVTARGTFKVADGPNEVLYGFPLYWHCWSGASSLNRMVDVQSLLIDLACYALLSAGLVWLAYRLPIVRRHGRNLTFGLAALATVALLTTANSFSFGVTEGHVAFSNEPRKLISYGVHFGFSFPY